jgi:Protein of unknown function (DUF3570)
LVRPGRDLSTLSTAIRLSQQHGCLPVSIALVLAPLLAASPVDAQEAGAAIYVRSDSDSTVVVAPRLRVQAALTDETRFDVVYAADVWSSASVDIMASASKVPVTEQRDELDLALTQEWQDLALTVAYRFSTEPDYVSHGASGGLSHEFADNSSTLALGLSGSRDEVGRAGDPQFSRGAATLGARLSFTQVLGVNTLLQAIYDLQRGSGYQASPYRFVAIGGDGLCTQDEGAGGSAPLCVPEHNPDQRLRHALAFELRHAFGDDWSGGLSYRFYLDDWGIRSHTASPELSWSPHADTIVSARYRFYVQSAADHYRERYDAPRTYMTSDKELSPLTSHRIGLELDRVFRFARDRTLTASLSIAPILYTYSAFARLDSIRALEVNLAMVFVP